MQQMKTKNMKCFIMGKYVYRKWNAQYFRAIVFLSNDLKYIYYFIIGIEHW